MKKIFLAVLAIVGVCNTTSAQYAPQKNDISVEIGFTPFKNNGDVFNLKDNAKFQVRWMFTDKDALRVKLGVGIDNNTEKTEFSSGNKFVVNPTAATRYTYGTSEAKNKMTSFSIAAGYERHFPLAQRLDLYAGGEFGVRTTSYSATVNGNSTVEDYDAAGKLTRNVTVIQDYEYTCRDATGRKSLNEITVTAFSGIDFYVYKGLYVGAELGIQFATGTNPKQSYYTMTQSVAGYDITSSAGISGNLSVSSETGLAVGSYTIGSTTTQINQYGGNDPISGVAYPNKDLNETSNTSLKFYVEPAFRLGWKF